MHNARQTASSLVLIIFAVLMISLFPVDRSSAQEPCFVEALKVAPGGEGLEFVFDGQELDHFFNFTLTAGDAGTIGDGMIGFGRTTIITEEPQHGYGFDGVECVGDPEIVITEIRNGFTIQCLSETPVSTFCTILNRPVSATGIPTISEWGMISVAAGLGIISLVFALRRRKTAA